MHCVYVSNNIIHTIILYTSLFQRLLFIIVVNNSFMKNLMTINCLQSTNFIIINIKYYFLYLYINI